MANKLKRQEEEQESLDRINRLTNRLKLSKRKVKPPKKKSNKELYTALGLELYSEYAIRPLETYKVKSFNLEKQQIDLIKHLYVKYPVPNFMYNIFFESKAVFGFEWFFCLAQGGSFQKLAKDFMTKKECVLFLSAPEDYKFVLDGIWFAKMKNLNIPKSFIDKLIFDKDFFNGQIFVPHKNNVEYFSKYDEVFNFYAKYHQDIDSLTFDEITDFIKYKVYNDKEFSLKGRTLNSVKMLSNEWHVLTQKAELGGRSEWTGMGLKTWSREEYDKDSGTEAIWEILELTTNHALINEGRKQKHCVASYVGSCKGGSLNIFSARKYNAATFREWEKNRITIAVRNGAITESRGNSNRPMNPTEKRIVKLFANQNNLTTSRWI